MTIKVSDLMTGNVITAQPHQTVGQLREKMAKRSLSNVPVVSPENIPIGVVSASDLLAAEKEGTPVSNIMTEKVYTIPEYEEVSVAARMMRNHKIHHLVVTQEQKVVGVVSSFDLLKLIEGHRFVMKNAPTPKSKGRGKRAKAELE
ncbi:CBS domain-containing protein [Thiogranum longum]